MLKLQRLMHERKNEREVRAINGIPIRGKFLDLPGEIRNQIYAYAVDPCIEPLLSPYREDKPEYVGISVLHLPIFRTSRQIRAECLSYLCAKFTLRIWGLHTATLFFHCIKDAVSEIKSLILVQRVIGVEAGKESREKVVGFFRALEMMHGLVEMRLETYGSCTDLKNSEDYIRLCKGVMALTERDIDSKIWSTHRRASWALIRRRLETMVV